MSNQADSRMPQSIQDKLIMADTLAKSGLLPNTLKTPAQIFVALQWGHELGLSPMVACNNIVVINGKPTLSADIMHALARANPEYAGCQWKCLTDEKAEVVITRNAHGINETFTGSFTIQQAQKAGLTGKDSWVKYPQRMLKHRALSYALRDAFPDVLAGVYTVDEIGESRNITPVSMHASSERDDLIAERQTLPEPQPSPKQAETLEALKAERKAIICELSKILLLRDDMEKPYFTNDERAELREWIKSVESTEEGIALLSEKRYAVSQELIRRMADLAADSPETQDQTQQNISF